MGAVENSMVFTGFQSPTSSFAKVLGSFPPLWITRWAQRVVLFHEVPPPFSFSTALQPLSRTVENLWKTDSPIPLTPPEIKS